MNNYTVLLLRPDFIADEFGKDTYLAHVRALNTGDAVKLAQMDAFESDVGQDDRADFGEDASDAYHVLFITIGHLQNLTEEES